LMDNDKSINLCKFFLKVKRWI